MAVRWMLHAVGQRRLKAIRLCSLLRIRNVPQTLTAPICAASEVS
jgi:hypothetical protein